MSGDSSVLILKREHSWQNRFRKFRVILDGIQVSQIADGQELSFGLAAGSHTLLIVLSDRYQTSQVDFVGYSGGTVHAVCGPAGPLPTRRELRAGRFDASNYLRLDILNGPSPEG